MEFFQSNIYIQPIQTKLDTSLQVFLFLLNTHFGVLAHVW